MKEIAHSGLLVSVYHSWKTSANIEVFDVSRKGQAKKIYSFEEVSGGRIIVKGHLILMYLFLVTGHGDVTYNPRRGFLGSIPVGGKIAYHLYNVASSKAGSMVLPLRKSTSHSQYSTNDSISLHFSIVDY